MKDFENLKVDMYNYIRMIIDEVKKYSHCLSDSDCLVCTYICTIQNLFEAMGIFRFCKFYELIPLNEIKELEDMLKSIELVVKIGNEDVLISF